MSNWSPGSPPPPPGGPPSAPYGSGPSGLTPGSGGGAQQPSNASKRPARAPAPVIIVAVAGLAAAAGAVIWGTQEDSAAGIGDGGPPVSGQLPTGSLPDLGDLGLGTATTGEPGVAVAVTDTGQPATASATAVPAAPPTPEAEALLRSLPVPAGATVDQDTGTTITWTIAGTDAATARDQYLGQLFAQGLTVNPAALPEGAPPDASVFTVTDGTSTVNLAVGTFDGAVGIEVWV